MMQANFFQNKTLGDSSYMPTNNFHKPIPLNYYETTTNKKFTYDIPCRDDWDKMIYGFNNTMQCSPANIYVGTKNLNPMYDMQKNYTNLEAISSGQKRDNVIPFTTSFQPKQYFSYC